MKLLSALQKLKNLNGCTSSIIRKKIVSADISYDEIVNAYSQSQFIGLFNLLGKDYNGNIRITCKRKVVQKICDYLQNLPNNPQK